MDAAPSPAQGSAGDVGLYHSLRPVSLSGPTPIIRRFLDEVDAVFHMICTGPMFTLLPLDGGNINVFGWASTNPIYGGTGSGSLNDAYPTVSLLEGMANAGFTTNAELSSFYTSYRADRPAVGMWAQEWTLPEPAAGQNGFNSLGRILSGAVNPSGKSADAFIKNFEQAPWWNNFGFNVYDNMNEFAAPEDDAFVPGALPHFVNYV